MANSVLKQSAVAGEKAKTRPGQRYNPFYDQVGRASFWLVSVAGYFFLWAPIVLLVVFSFNDSRSVNAWHGFTFRWYENIFSTATGTEATFASGLLMNAVVNSMFVGFFATLISTILGTMVALSLVMRHEVLNCCPEGALAKQDQSFQAGFLDAAHEALRVGVQIGTSGRQFH